MSRRQDLAAKPPSVSFGKWFNHYTRGTTAEKARLKCASTLSLIAAGKLSREKGMAKLPADIKATAINATPAELLTFARQLSSP